MQLLGNLLENLLENFKDKVLRYELNRIYAKKYINNYTDVLRAYQKDENDVFNNGKLQSKLRDISKLNFHESNEEEDIYEKCKKYIDEFMLFLKFNGYSNLDSNDVFRYYPKNASTKMNLLAEYIYNTPFCQFLEAGENEFENKLIIKLNSTSSNKELNAIRNFIKKANQFKDLILVFNYDPNKKINFLSLKGIRYEKTGKFITVEDGEWLNVVQNAYLQLLLIETVYHAYWHLFTAYIVNMAKQCLTNKDDELLKLFEIGDHDQGSNIFTKSLEVKFIIFKTPLFFNTPLYDNKNFIEFTNSWINNFIKNFDIDTFYKKNITKNLNTNHAWISGFKENLYEIKKYTRNIMKKTKTKYMNINKYNILSNEYKHDKLIKCSTEKLLQILMVVGGLFHSQSFEYQKIAFTDIIKSSSQFKYLILINTMDYSPTYNVYGDLALYTGDKYKSAYEKFNKRVVSLKKKTEKNEKKNKIFRLFVYSSKNTNEKHLAMFTPNTFI